MMHITFNCNKMYVRRTQSFFYRATHNKKYHSGIRGIYITNTSTMMVFANEKNRFTTITVSQLLLPFP